jgi:hypothetical protein
MSLTTWFGWRTSIASEEIPDIFPLAFKKEDFIKIDTVNIYSKILTDVVERVHGMSDDIQSLLWDNCVKSESGDGLITLLSNAMSDKQDLFLVFNKALKVLRKATGPEEAQIKKDYEKSGDSSIGVFISFKNYTRSDMVKLYSGLEYCTVSALNKSSNLSKAIQIKISDLRSSVSLGDSAGAKAQASAIAKALSEGKDVMCDAKDIIETAKPDLTSVKEAILFLNQKRSLYLGLPESYINGEQTAGLGATGEGDTKAVERGLKNYYFSIIKPVVEKIFGTSLTYKSQDFRQVASALEALKTFELTGEELLNIENKKKIIEGMLDIDEADNKTVAPAKPDPKLDPKAVDQKPTNKGPQV